MAEKLRTLITAHRIQRRVRALGAEIARDYRGQELVLVGILKGSFIFMADLARAIHLPMTCEFLRVSSYGDGTTSSGSVRLDFDLTNSIRGRHVLIVEDIVDTGMTLRFLLRHLKLSRPASLRICTLLHKEERTKVKMSLDYVGFRIPDKFVIGYGLDYAGRYRNLPNVGFIEKT